jgi:hypothetical protein
MIRLPRASVIAALCLLVWTATASAECAWVLWVRAAPADRSGTIIGAWTSWVSYGATTGASGCDDLTPKNPEANKRVIDATGVRLAPDQLGSIAWQCLPDTVDPRGPKGK